VVGYLKGFLFSARRALTPVTALSGGERNRVILAKLFTRPTNLLVLDEPTNDLDVETLEVLEQRLAEFAGTLIVVSHDREFLDNVVDRVLVFEDGDRIVAYAGGWSEWECRGLALAERDDPLGQRRRKAPDESPGARARAAPTKLGYKDQRELDALPQDIAAIEAEIADIEADIAAPGFYDQPWEATRPVLDRLAGRQAVLDRLTERWLELEARRESLAGG
jgi:ATP-binding cassette subfamily F protein uup